MFNMLWKSVLAASLLLGMGGLAGAADSGSGQALHDKNCRSCHDAKVYTRDNRRVKSPEGLHTQVQRCEKSLGLNWSEKQVNNVAAYLNSNFYHFE
jgi:mono/diheme cytochrome c family protein